ncbi:HAD-IC family P-type ATPase [Marivirga sp. S37H4]|uniref:P-type Ca(2+) transporter n=1 Tax=Marivirga aurantiaca TaxID=2802615 RepID=A0A934WZ61_9BACT|nr:HAD-IC family P-type ATPase [Marivirga aurantiaca]MBK6265577.1 HAD-IC family P-type ATPase [Marivirga aurantiaca]
MEIDQKYSYHSIEIDEAIEKVSGKKEGLSSDEAKKRQEEFGENKLPEKGGTNAFKLFIKQFKDFLILILFIAAGVAFWADQMADVYIILAVILFNAIMGFTQEYKAEKAIEAIKSLQQKFAIVVRDGKEQEIPAEDVVPGDIILLKEGNTIPADGRLIEAHELRTAEASLTGESMPVDKNTEPAEEDAPIGDRINMAWKSTNVVNGKGKAVVTAIGNNTEIGKIAKSMGEMEMQDSNFKKKTSLLGKQMAVIAIITAVVIFSLGYWVHGDEFQEILLVTIAVLVSTIPEGLPAVISIVLAIGANRMAKQNALIREFTATEMMGSVSVILADKTGTLTQSILVIKKIFTGSGKELAVTGTGYQLEGKFKDNGNEFNLKDNPVESKLLAIAAFCNDAHIKEGDGKEENDQHEKKPDSGNEQDKPSAKEQKNGKEETSKSDGHDKNKKSGEIKTEEDKEKQEKSSVDSDERDKGKQQNDMERKEKEEEQKKKVDQKSESGKEKEAQKDKAETKSGETDAGKKEKDQDIDVDVEVEPDKVKIDVSVKSKKKNTNEEDEEIEEEEEEEEEIEEEEEDDDNDNEEGPEIAGDPTEAAMLVVGKKAKVKETEPFNQYKLLDDLPFKSEQKFRASLVDTEEGPEIFAIGAPERILELSTQYLTPEGPKDLTDEKREEIDGKMDQWAGEAMRVLALGYKKAEGKENISPGDVKDIVWVGITGIIDPPREGVPESIKECKSAGIRVIMVTGDHKKTAAAIAEDVGILESKEEKEDDKHPPSITTKELDVDDEEFDNYIENINVFARMNPGTKLRIAERLQAKDTLIAMTGDGVNDAPALKRADVGIAMGIRGTDVAKDASEIVLQDDNFSSIVNAIREGRIVFNNVKITSYFLLTTNFAFAIAYIFGMSIGWPLLFTAAQILYVNLITDGIMDVALATEPGHGDIMNQPPVKKSEKILKWDVVPYILVVSLVMVTLTLLTFQYYLPQGEVMARTGAFIVVSSTQLFNAYNLRSLRLSVFEIGVFTNKWVNMAFLAAIVLQIVVVKVPAIRDFMKFEDLPVLDLAILIIMSVLILAAGELYKYLKFKKNLF